jgi:hypothetical protein
MRTSRACYSTVFSQLWTRYVAIRRGRKCGDQFKEQPAKWRGTILCHLVATSESKSITSQVFGTWQMNEWITALWHNPNEATYGQAAFAIPRCKWMNEWICVLPKELWPCLLVNESALCYRRMSVWMFVCLDVTKCIVTKLQMLQTSPLAQIYLLTIDIDLPRDVDKFRHFGRRPPSWISEDEHLKIL